MHSQKSLITVNAICKDRPGIVAELSNWFFKHKGNITECEAYQVTPTLFGAHFKTEISSSDGEGIKNEIKQLCSQLNMKSKVIIEGDHRKKKAYLLVTKEEHCAKTLLMGQHELRFWPIDIIGGIGSDPVLRPLFESWVRPFSLVDIPERFKHDQKIFEIIEKEEPDFLILARYMRKIVDPGLLWLYRNLIINIHPSLLPSFPGANAYLQAYEEKVHMHGATAHFVNEKMDRGPIIWQESYHRLPNESYDSFVRRGREIEEKTLIRAMYLFASDAISLRKDAAEIKQGAVPPDWLK